MRPRLIQLHPNRFVETSYELARSSGSHDGLADADVQNIISALRLDQVNFCRYITRLLAALDQYSLRSNAQRDVVVPDCHSASVCFSIKAEKGLHSIEMNIGCRVGRFQAAIDYIHDRA